MKSHLKKVVVPTQVVVGVAHHMSHAMTVINNVVNVVHKEVNIMVVEVVQVVIEVVNMVVNNVASMNTPRHKGQDVVIIVRVVVTEVVMVKGINVVVKVQNLLDTNTKETRH